MSLYCLLKEAREVAVVTLVGSRHTERAVTNIVLLAGVCRRRLSSSSLTLKAGGRAGRRMRGWSAAAGRVDGRAARQASTVTSR